MAASERQDDAIALNGRESDVIDIKQSLNRLHISSNTGIGGISLTYTNGPGALAIVGVISNKQIGFSTTMRFIDHASEMTTHLQAANIPIGKPPADSGFTSSVRFTPHVVVRNNTGVAVQVNLRIRFTLFDQPNTIELPDVTLSANEVRELDLHSVFNVIGDNIIADSGIEIDYTGQPGGVMAYAASVDQNGSNVFDVSFPEEMGFQGGSYPWHLDGDNRAVLHVKSIDLPGDSQVGEFLVKLYFNGGEYDLPLQRIEAGQTAAIDLKQLRDDQVRDVLGRVIPLSVTGGQLAWYPRKGEFIGRLVEYDPVAGVSASFSCVQPCDCHVGYLSGFLSPDSFDGEVGDSFTVIAYEVDGDCNGANEFTFPVSASFYSTDTSVLHVSRNTVQLVGAGNAGIIGEWQASQSSEQCGDEFVGGRSDGCFCESSSVTGSGETFVAARPRIDSISPSRGVISGTTHISISGSGFAAGATVNPGTGITASNPSVSSSTSMSVDLAVASNATGGNHSLAVTVNRQTSNSVNFYVQIPSKIVPLNIPNVAPNGIGPLVTPVNEARKLIDGTPINPGNFCGVYRNYAFFLGDQDNPSQEIAFRPYKFKELFSDYTAGSTFWTQPEDFEVPIPALLADLQSIGLLYPDCLGTTDWQKFNQKFVVTIGNNPYSLSTVIHVERGNFSGTLKVDRTISTP